MNTKKHGQSKNGDTIQVDLLIPLFELLWQKLNGGRNGQKLNPD
jgi:hypothetical protein